MLFDSTMDLRSTAIHDNLACQNVRCAASSGLVIREASTALLSAVLLYNNEGGASAGAIVIEGAGTQLVGDRVAFYSNRGLSNDRASGALMVAAQADVSLRRAVFENNLGTSDKAGGAAVVLGASLTLVDAQVRSNYIQAMSIAKAGAGGIYSEQSSINMHSLVESLNDAVDEVNGHRSSNAFAKGMYSVSPVRPYVIDSKFEAFDDVLSALIVPGVSRGKMRGSCQEFPCDRGYGCTFTNATLKCTPCADTTHSSNGIECTMCPAGTGPLADRTGCSPCVGNNASLFGVCSPCVGKSSEDKSSCDPCPSGQIPTPDNTGCQCELGTYNATQGFITCNDMDYIADSFDTESRYVIARDQWAHQDMQCLICPPCVDCLVSPIRVRPGFAVADVQNETTDQTAGAKNKTLFRCRPETAHTDSFGAGELATGYTGGSYQCVGGSLVTLDLSCSTGHEGVLCGVCSEGFGRKNENECHPCDSAVDPFQVVRLMGVLVALAFVLGLILIGLSFHIGDVYEDEGQPGTEDFRNPLAGEDAAAPDEQESDGRLKRAVSHAKILKTSKRLMTSGARMSVIPAKIFLGYFQISGLYTTNPYHQKTLDFIDISVALLLFAAHLEDVLHTEFPPLIAALFGKFKWLVVNINGIVALECAGLKNFHMIWLFEVIVVPLGLCTVVGCYWLYRNYAISRAYANTKIIDEAFLVLFLIYPVRVTCLCTYLCTRPILTTNRPCLRLYSE